MENLVMVTVNVPGDRLPEFYEAFGKWLAGKTTGFGVAEVAPVAPGELDWDEGPLDQRISDAKAFYRGITPDARMILDYLTDRPNQQVGTPELENLLGVSAGSVAGKLSTMGTWRKQFGRTLPYERVGGPDGGLYRMKAGVAEAFAIARDSSQG